MSAFHDTALAGASGQQGYQISRSVRLRSSAGAYFSRTFSSSPATRTKAVLSAWVKRGQLGTNQMIMSGYDGSSSYRTSFYFNTSDQLAFELGGSSVTNIVTSQVFRDPSAYYHLVLAIDTTQATASSRVVILVNGVQVTAFSASNYPAQNAVHQYAFGNALNYIGTLSGASYYFDGYLTELNFLDGQAPSLPHLLFGETDSITGVWKPKAYTGSYGTNGFRLDFSDPTAGATGIGKDRAGSNNWTPNNISLTTGATYDSMLDVPTAWGDRGNYPTWNPLFVDSAKMATIADGNLSAYNSATTGGGWQHARTTMAIPTTGKWYWEQTYTSGSNQSTEVGIGPVTQGVFGNNGLGGTSTMVGLLIQSNGGNLKSFQSTTYSASYGAPATGDVYGFAYDAAAGSLAIYVNNSLKVTCTGITVEEKSIFQASYCFSTSYLVTPINFGQRPFAYTPPTGFKALHTGNLPEPTIKKGGDWFDVKLDTGANIKTTAEAYGGSSFMEWIKDRANANNHQLIDTVRGTSAVLQSNSTGAETTYSAPTGNSVAWVWKKGATPGFDVVTYAGDNSATRSIAHSLGVPPAMIFVKGRNSTFYWRTWHKALGNPASTNVFLNDTQAATADSQRITGGDSSTFSITGNAAGYVNGSGYNYVAYLFSEVSGFSKFGSYTGNGSADGPFVFCGFRPRYVMIKRTDTTADWEVLDTARESANGMGALLNPNLSAGEVVQGPFIDCLSNGFKLRSTNAFFNASGGTYIFAAFAENPFKYSLAR